MRKLRTTHVATFYFFSEAPVQASEATEGRERGGGDSITTGDGGEAPGGHQVASEGQGRLGSLTFCFEVGCGEVASVSCCCWHKTP